MVVAEQPVRALELRVGDQCIRQRGIRLRGEPLDDQLRSQHAPRISQIRAAQVVQHSCNRIAFEPFGHVPLDHDRLTILVDKQLSRRIDPGTCAESIDVAVDVKVLVKVLVEDKVNLATQQRRGALQQVRRDRRNERDVEGRNPPSAIFGPL